MLKYLAAAILGLSLVQPALAQDNYFGVVVVANPTEETLNYGFAWGDAEPELCTLEPGEFYIHSWAYDFANENASPVPTILFDADMSDGQSLVSYELAPYASPSQDENYAHVYGFQIDYDNVSVDLFDADE